MRSIPVRRSFVLTTVLLVMLAPVLWVLDGPQIVKSLFLGFSAAALSVLSITYLAAAIVAGKGVSPKQAGVGSAVVLMLKFPLIGLICFKGLDDSVAARNYFLLGAGMVYSTLIAFALMDLRSSS